MKVILRLVNVALSLFISYQVFGVIYNEFYSYLPEFDRLDSMNKAVSITQVLRENSHGLRELYNEAFEKSLKYSLISFITSIIVFEYIALGSLLSKYFGDMKKDVEDIREVKS